MQDSGYDAMITRRSALKSAAGLVGTVTVTPTTVSAESFKDKLGHDFLVNEHSDKVLEVAGGSTENGAEVQQWERHNGDNQIWKVQSLHGGFDFRIMNKHSGKFLEVAGWGTDNGDNIVQWEWHGGDNQRWKRFNTPTGWHFENVYSGKVMEVAGWKTENGANVQQWDHLDNENQAWYHKNADFK